MTDLQDLLRHLLSLRVKIDMYLVGDKIMYNVNTGAKSQLEFWEEDGELKCFMRYGSSSTVTLNQTLAEITRDLARLVCDCMHGRDYIDMAWQTILEGYELIKVEVTTSRNVRFT
ncbi:hypothetical protein PQC39_gp087 [Vibrio phage Vp_R1]|uniref:Uncharacterized protein n=1 Tax=Vibrio phage Vp_R1 TaxID=2059867 RepID=A0A2H5BQ37_9CAUD|nr:hypothetical protein PQC39_gp087 [Vibrio phage Vp_R1]AUG88451.1 hypothetical protein VPR_087 [Vibrio phage Vp_R1]